MARGYLEDAAYSLREAYEALAEERHHRAVRRAQESVELSLKAALRLLGVEHPREHDVSGVLSEVAQYKELPGWFRSELDVVNTISKELAEARGPAFYGDEGAFIPPMQLYTREDARKAVDGAEKVYNLCNKLFKWWREKIRG
ncbi:HEPN domain-containing protein [Candidatus Bathyarchaeota archaeon]|nr:HEPN domain-containing protein [Candidatus Bathyarchaeota archaeon]